MHIYKYTEGKTRNYYFILEIAESFDTFMNNFYSILFFNLSVTKSIV